MLAKYIGCFFNKSEVLEIAKNFGDERLAKVIENPHVTFWYMPESEFFNLYGERVNVTVIGYGNDGKNEALLVELSSDNEEINELISKIKVKHITVSISLDGKAVDSNYIEYEECEERYKLVGVFGAFRTTGEVYLGEGDTDDYDS